MIQTLMSMSLKQELMTTAKPQTTQSQTCQIRMLATNIAFRKVAQRKNASDFIRNQTPQIQMGP